MTDRTGGYRFDLETASTLFALKTPSPEVERLLRDDVEIPQSMTYRGKLPVLNQGQEGSCNGYSVRAVACVNHLLATGGDFREFSGDGAYYACQRIDGISGDNGSTITGGLKLQRDIGVMTAADFPMTPTYDPRRLPTNYKELSAPYRVAKAVVLRSIRDIEEWLGRGYGGVWWGCRWGFTFDGRGNVTRWSRTGGGHATAIFGFNRREKWFDGLNSWGSTWQGQGWYRLPYSIFEQVLADEYTVIAGASDMTEIKPRKVDWIKESINA